jgi:hypothetical protein
MEKMPRAMVLGVFLSQGFHSMAFFPQLGSPVALYSFNSFASSPDADGNSY